MKNKHWRDTTSYYVEHRNTNTNLSKSIKQPEINIHQPEILQKEAN